MSGSTAWPRVRLGEVLKRSTATVDPVVDQEYREITVRLWGKGVVERGRLPGASVSGRRFVARTGQFIASRIDARNGAMGLVPTSLDGALVSNDFPLFEVHADRLLPDYLDWMCRTASFVELCARASEGSTNRVRLKEDEFLGLEIALPPLAEQQRIVGRIEELAALLRQASALRTEASTTLETLRARIRQSIFSGAATGLVADFVRFQTGYAFKSEWFSENGIRLARNANIGHGRLDWSETARIPADRRAEFSAFELQEGDILLALDRPLISTGVKVVQVVASDLPALLLQRVARAKFTGDQLLPSYFFRWLQSPLFANAIDPGRSNGVPHISHKDVEKLPIHVPAVSEQERIVESLFEAEHEVHALERMQAQTRTELDALLPAILDRAFAGAL